MKIRNLETNYRFNKTGEETLLFLHGWGGSLKSFEFLENYFFEKGYSTINLDFWGFGFSEQPQFEFSIFDYAFCVFDLLKNLNVKKVTIISHSFGSRVAIILASLYNNFVDKLVIIDGAGLKPKFSFKTFFKIKQYKFLKFLVNLKICKKEMLENFGSKDYKQLTSNMKKIFIKVINENLCKYLKKIKASTLLIWGENDQETPLYMAKKIKNHIKDCGLIVYKNCSHFSYLEQPQKTKIILTQFLKGE